MDDNLKDYHEAVADAKMNYRKSIDKFKTDFDYYAGNQLTEQQRSILRRKKRPDTVQNFIKKTVDLFVGHQMQNRSDLLYFPVQNADDILADTYTQLSKWQMHEGKGHYKFSRAFKNASICGMGWLYCDMVEDYFFYGKKIRMKSLSPFSVATGNFTEVDLEDCPYVLYYSEVKREDLAAMPQYKDSKQDILNLSQLNYTHDNMFFQEAEANRQRTYGEWLSVTEMWTRSLVTREFSVDLSTLKVEEITNENRQLEEFKAAAGTHMIVKRVIPEIRLRTVVNDEILIYDKKNPHGIRRWPFIPILSTYIEHYDDWDYKIQGVVRSLIDMQKERNKRRQQLNASALEMPFSGWMVKRGSVRNWDQFQKQTGAGRKLEWQGDAKPEQIQSQPLPQSLLQLLEIETGDLREIGPTYEMLGIKDESRQPGITNQLRQRQGMTASQDMYENAAMAFEQLGLLMADYFRQIPEQKLRSFLNKNAEFPMNWEEDKDYAIVDCMVGETVDSPTYRSMVFAQLLQLAEKGFDIQYSTIVDYMELPFAAKRQLKEHAEMLDKAKNSDLILKIAQAEALMRGGQPGGPQKGGGPQPGGPNIPQ